MNRNRGVLLHISSLPSPYGIGTMGKAAFAFADWLKAAGFNLWQVLPICPTSYGDSPYQSPSAFAGNPYFIDLDILQQEGLLTKEQLLSQKSKGEINYENLYLSRYPLLVKAFERFNLDDTNFAEFCREQSYWINDYAYFMALKSAEDMRGRSDWKIHAHTKGIDMAFFTGEGLLNPTFWLFLQYKFYGQWHSLKQYVNNLGIQIVGDMPIYVADDSADVWAHPELFMLDQNDSPSLVAGVPPDVFSETGQLWGNPLYNWSVLKEQNFNWWIQRLKVASLCFDIVRIDHFRGFDRFYAVPAHEETALHGEWQKAEGAALFARVATLLPQLKIIAEDLGVMDDGVRQLIASTTFPGMKIMQFGFDGNPNHEFLPHCYPENSAAYTGSHDNDTTAGWLSTMTTAQKQDVRRLLGGIKGNLVWGMIQKLFDSRSRYAVVPMQDLLQLKSEARMNLPGKKDGNWKWRLKSLPSAVLANKCHALLKPKT